MRYSADLDHRRSVRLQTWDYCGTGAYFVTICAHERFSLFGRFVADELVLNHFGHIVENLWRSVVGGRPDELIVMPNHVHGIVWIRSKPITGPVTPVGVEQLPGRQPGYENVPDCSSTSSVAVAQPLRCGLRDGLKPGSLFVILRTFKSAAAKRINNHRCTVGARVWQRGYHERIIRDDGELNAAREYILDNPRKWAYDKYNPAVSGRRQSHRNPA